MSALDEARLKDAVKFMHEADKNTEKSWFKKPDWDIAAQYYEKAAQSFKSAKSYEQAVQAFIKTSDAMINATSMFMAARALENGANVCLQNLGQPERAVDMYKRASQLYMQNMTPDRAAEMLEKGAKAMEPISVESAMDLYIEACEIYESEERAKYATDTYKKTIALLVRNKRYPKATEILERLGKVQSEATTKSPYFKTLLSIIIIQLAGGDEVEASRKFQGFCSIDGFVRSEESAIAHAMLDAFEHRDQNYYNQAANRQHVGFLDNEIARLARNIVVSGDLVSGGGYVDPSNPGLAAGGNQPGGPYNNNSGYPSQQGPPPSGNQLYPQSQQPPRQPSPFQQQPPPGGFSAPKQQGHLQEERSESDWRALTGAPPAPHQHQQYPQQGRQQPPGNAPPSQGYYQDDDEGLL
ncbi:soluble NSF attachment protein [Mortierella sp. GBAus27b]|nr:soluble NSF attachment protein [Mortierella sp. GBAus27b]